MNLVLCMAGLYSRFREENYQTPKFLLKVGNNTILTEVVSNLLDGNHFEEILLIANKRDINYQAKIHKSIESSNIDKYELIFIEDTNGQAETAYVGAVKIAKLNSQAVLFHNIDTIIKNRRFTHFDNGIKGGIDVFNQSSEKFSYVKLNSGYVVDIAEKAVISKNATTGAYVFDSAATYIKYYDSIKWGGERYISHVYKKMIEAGEKIIIYETVPEDTIVLGTPAEYEGYLEKLSTRDDIEYQSSIVIDLDDTITINNKKYSYENKPLNKDVLRTLRSVKEDFEVTVLTARNMRTYGGNKNLIEKNTRGKIEDWLLRNTVPYDELIVGKPWCGPNGYYVDDRNLHIEEFIFKFSKNIKELEFDIVVSFYNESGNVEPTYRLLKKVERFFHVKNFIFVNNASLDDTGKKIEDLCQVDSKIVFINNTSSRGYGDGYKAGIMNSTADYILTNHADCQFNTAAFIMIHMDILKDLSEKVDAVFPVRVNRPLGSQFFTAILKKLVKTFFSLDKSYDFNGQPKIFKRTAIEGNIQSAPHDFTFDLWLFLHLKDQRIAQLPVLEANRLNGESSWNRGFLSILNIAYSYIKRISELRKNL